MFSGLVEQVFKVSGTGFVSATDKLVDYIDSSDDFIGILEQIGAIPESIAHDSTEEKLFAKASDAVLARAFREIGLKATLISGRGDCADVQAQSPIHGYTVVADAKAFRMSRTAKNQKDFKVVALSRWREDADYAVLCCPHFQYPRASSQIYAQSIEHNVCLLSGENLILMIKNGICESDCLDLSPLWSFGDVLSRVVVVANKKNCFLSEYNEMLCKVLKLRVEDYSKLLCVQADIMRRRGEAEKAFWKGERDIIRSYTKEIAIRELIKAKKIDEKILQIDRYIKGLSHD